MLLKAFFLLKDSKKRRSLKAAKVELIRKNETSKKKRYLFHSCSFSYISVSESARASARASFISAKVLAV